MSSPDETYHTETRRSYTKNYLYTSVKTTHTSIFTLLATNVCDGVSKSFTKVIKFELLTKQRGVGVVLCDFTHSLSLLYT